MRAFGWLMCGVSFLMGAPLVFWPHSIAPLMQPVLTVYILLNFWVAIGLASLLLGQRLKTGLTNYVALICFAGLAFIFYRGPFNNGEIIPCPDKQPPAAGLREQVKSWLKAREKEFDDNAPYPVFFVAGEGGGIRAAAWTATNLAVLEDHSTSWSTTDEIAPSPEKRFSRHLFAISTVSGSSLGAAAFLALLNESGSNPEFYASRSRRAFERRTVNLLNRDFLSPTLASLLFSEILRGMSHWELAPDRGQVLQKSFEAAWDATFGVRPGVAGRFSQPFSQLWPTTNSALPALAFNGTAADSGSRIVYASFDFDFGTDSDAIGIRRLLADQDIPLSTAVLMSARFPLISPMGLFPEQSPAGGIEAVDGGFVDNSGAATLIEIIEIFRTTARELGYANKLRIYALSFSNSLGSSTALEDHRIFDPVLVFDRVRQQSAKRFLRLLDVAVQDSGGELLKINLRKDRIAGPELSLGWMLSNESWDGILAQVHCGLAEPSSNSFKVLELLRGSWKQKREAPAGAKLCWERRPPERE